MFSLNYWAVSGIEHQVFMGNCKLWKIKKNKQKPLKTHSQKTNPTAKKLHHHLHSLKIALLQVCGEIFPRNSRVGQLTVAKQVFMASSDALPCLQHMNEYAFFPVGKFSTYHCLKILPFPFLLISDKHRKITSPINKSLQSQQDLHILLFYIYGLIAINISILIIIPYLILNCNFSYVCLD